MVGERDAPYTVAIRFAQPAESETGYLDEPVMKAPTVRQAVEKVRTCSVKDVLGGGNVREAVASPGRSWPVQCGALGLGSPSQCQLSFR